MSWHLVVRAATHLAKRKLASQLGRAAKAKHVKHVAFGLAVATTPIGIVLFVVILGAASLTVRAPAAAAGGALGIPATVFSAYLAAETNAASIAPDCAVDWPVIAGIWKVESGHATHGGRTVTPSGEVTPPLYGPTLDGTVAGTAIIADTDAGALDGDPTWDRAVGPAQFLPGSWRAYGQDANRDGLADPQNVYDAALATVVHLCLTTPGDYTNPTDLARALRRYNNSAEYVITVAGWIDYYRAFRFTQGEVTADGLYAFPLPHDTVTVAQIRRSHHDYPASDLAVPEGTPVYAAHPGIVTAISAPCADIQQCRCGWGVHVAGADGHTYTYCHGSQVLVQPRDQVVAGQLIMASGNTGNSQGPHLHFQIRNPDGHLVCAQTALEAWWSGIAMSPVTAPLSGCTH